MLLFHFGVETVNRYVRIKERLIQSTFVPLAFVVDFLMWRRHCLRYVILILDTTELTYIITKIHIPELVSMKPSYYEESPRNFPSLNVK